MRRFVDTTAGRAFCHLAAIALVLPTVTLTLAGRAEAQVTQLPSWAITEFKDLKGGATSKYGQVAADAVASELAKTNQYDVVPQESVKRSIETLGLSSPPEGLVNLSRIGQDVRATTIVAGEVIDYKVNAVGGGKQAIVAVRMVAYDVSSGLPVNGALEKGESTIRSGNVTDAALISDAVTQAATSPVTTVAMGKATTKADTSGVTPSARRILAAARKPTVAWIAQTGHARVPSSTPASAAAPAVKRKNAALPVCSTRTPTTSTVSAARTGTA